MCRLKDTDAAAFSPDPFPEIRLGISHGTRSEPLRHSYPLLSFSETIHIDCVQHMFDILEADIVVMQETKIQRKDLQDDMILVPGWDVFFSLPKHKKGTDADFLPLPTLPAYLLPTLPAYLYLPYHAIPYIPLPPDKTASKF